MSITIDRLFDDPGLYFHSLDGDHARFVDMDRGHFSQSIFFDRRIVRPNDQIYRIPLDLLLEAQADRDPPPPRLNFIHHVAQCGSTLLARALDREGDSLVIREPFHLRQLGVQVGGRIDSSARLDLWRSLLRLSLTMLGKRYEANAPLVIKGNVPISMIGEAIDETDPGQAGILLHFPLDDYLAAVLRTPNHGQWVDSVVGELRLGQDPAVGGVDGLSTPERAGALWLSLVTHYDRLLHANPAMRSLDANRLFDEPAATIHAAAELFAMPMSTSQAAEIAAGPLFETYAKNPDHPYDPAQRIERREEAKQELGQAFAEARRWVEARLKSVKLPASLDRPLLGQPAALL